jgi:hypothetical protein
MLKALKSLKIGRSVMSLSSKFDTLDTFLWLMLLGPALEKGMFSASPGEISRFCPPELRWALLEPRELPTAEKRGFGLYEVAAYYFKF